VTFSNACTAGAHVVTRTVYVTDPCTPVTKTRSCYAGTDPGTCHR
jgi:hypothetical protein